MVIDFSKFPMIMFVFITEQTSTSTINSTSANISVINVDEIMRNDNQIGCGQQDRQENLKGKLRRKKKFFFDYLHFSRLSRSKG